MATVQRYVNTGSTAGGDGTTNATSGSTRAYASLSEWEANSGGSATDDYIVDCCAEDTGSGNVADTTACVVDFATNITTGSVLIRANTSVATGFYDGDAVISSAHYRLSPGDTFFPLRFNEARCTADGLQIVAGHTGANGVGIYCTTAEYAVRKCRLLNTASCDYGIGNSGAVSGSSARTFENNLIVGFDLCGIAVVVTNFFTPTVTIQHNTVYGDGSSTSGGIRYGGSGANSGTVFNIKGNAVGNCGSGNDLIKVSAASSTDNFDDNAFEYSESTSGEIALGTLTDAWTSPGTSTSSDFTVKDASSPLNFTVTGSLVSDDIRGTTRSNYSVGAFEFVSGGGTTDGAGSSSGVGGASGVGASTAASASSSAGVGSASAVGSSTAASVGSSAGVGAASAVGEDAASGTTDGVASAAGVGAASGVGASTSASSAESAGIATASAVAEALQTIAAVGSADGVAVVSAVGSTVGAAPEVALVGDGYGLTYSQYQKLLARLKKKDESSPTTKYPSSSMHTTNCPRRNASKSQSRRLRCSSLRTARSGESMPLWMLASAKPLRRSFAHTSSTYKTEKTKRSYC